MRLLFGIKDYNLKQQSKEEIMSGRNKLMTSIIYPKMPQDLCVRNSHAGTIPVSPHAWRRFIERWQVKTNNSPEVIAQFMQYSFKRAQLVTLKKRFATYRLISNAGKLAEYYLDASIACRFVVSTIEPGHKILFTVERPFD